MVKDASREDGESDSVFHGFDGWDDEAVIRSGDELFPSIVPT